MDLTKKLPVSISFGDNKTNANEFLVPDPSGNTSLIGIKTGNKYKYGAISYMGVKISTSQIIQRLTQNQIAIPDEKSYHLILMKYIGEIYNYKISNI